MKQIQTLLICCLVMVATIVPASAQTQYYQLREYQLATEAQEELTDFYLEESYIPALKRAGIGQIGVFKNHRTEKDTLTTIYVLIPMENLQQLTVLEDVLEKDKLHKKVGEPYLNAPYDQPPMVRVSGTVLKAFSHMPRMATPDFKTPREERVYELRSYESATDSLYRNKVDMFNAGGEIELFDSLDFNAVFYAEVLAGSRMPNLMYMTTFKDRETRDSRWEDFINSPKWNTLKRDPKYQNNVSKNDTMLLYPTSYSDY